ncbi:MAG: Uma2 family endonuclease [Bacteroidetes bacterium SW_9_63_38]|nr:MAG: Uma2 family endonuclease [Bacteroidetes bacterium SW_9_63_38]
MPTTTTREQQERWANIVNDPLLNDLPYKIETNARGQILLSPHTFQHADAQGRLLDLLRTHTDAGRGLPEFPLCTDAGTKQIDVVWASDERLSRITDSGDPPTIAPEICIEVMSESNNWDEMHQKRTLYREAGADEVWIVDRDGQIHFFQDEERDRSDRAPDVPSSL